MAAPAISTGAELDPVSRVVTMEDMILFEPEGDRNMHTDDDIARAVGLPGAIAAGVQFMSYIFEMLQLAYGPASVPGTVLDVRVRAPVFAGDTITAHGTVNAAGDGRVMLDVWCENQRGEHVIAGTADVPLISP